MTNGKGQMTSTLLKTAIFLIIAPGTVIVYVPYLLLGRRFQIPTEANLLGLVLVLPGAAILLICAWDFGVTGRGTPAPIDPPKILVARGLYRYVRNPMYVGVALVLLGESILFASARVLGYALCVCLAFHLFVLFYEEPGLRRKFGDSYVDYCHRVNRWLPRAKSLHT